MRIDIMITGGFIEVGQALRRKSRRIYFEDIKSACLDDSEIDEGIEKNLLIAVVEAMR
jgi:hypothetical protein